MRQETRRQRYTFKSNSAQILPVSLVTINFDFDDNLAFLIRIAACYGIKCIYVIGRIPDRSLLKAKSGSTVDYVKLIGFANPIEFLQYSRVNRIKMVSAELIDGAKSLYDYKFRFHRETAIILGHETCGVPVEISRNSDSVYIPMIGIGYCLNVAMAGTVFANEYVRQYIASKSTT